MKNEFGVVLDRSRYAPSIMQEHTDRCYICGRSDQKLDRHEPFNGPNREQSKRLGMWVVLCSERCHHGGAHKDFQISQGLKRAAQRAAMREYGWDTKEWIERFGKNWL